MDKLQAMLALPEYARSYAGIRAAAEHEAELRAEHERALALARRLVVSRSIVSMRPTFATLQASEAMREQCSRGGRLRTQARREANAAARAADKAARRTENMRKRYGVDTVVDGVEREATAVTVTSVRATLAPMAWLADE
jgi:hypothetical protein